MFLVNIPNKFRSEGRISLYYSHEGGSYTYEYVFQELVDSLTRRSRVSIAPKTRIATEYIARQAKPLITIDPNKECSRKPQNTDRAFVPELHGFIEKDIPSANVREFLGRNPHMIGPTGLLMMVQEETKGMENERQQDPISHRNILCDVYVKRFTRRGAETVSLNTYVPSNSILGSSGEHINFVTVHEVSHGVMDTHGSLSNMSYVIDYFYIDSLCSAIKIDQMEEDFASVLGVGCGAQLQIIHPQLNTINYLIMSYSHWPSYEPYTIVYDRAQGYLKRESPGGRKTIWDRQAMLRYNVEPIDLPRTYVKRSLCSIINVGYDSDESPLPSSLKPFREPNKDLSVGQLLGTTEIAYIGRAKVRDIPCVVFESTSKVIPLIFNLTSTIELERSKEIDYIVQYYVLHPRRDDTEHIITEFEHSSDKDFWLAQIRLYGRTSQGIRLLETLEVHSFHFNLHGWSTKASEMFMVPECFKNEHEITSLEMTMSFDDVDHSESSNSLDIFARNRYGLEFDLIDQMFSKVLQISRVHLIEFNLNLRPHHVVLDLMIGGREEQKRRLTYMGKGQLPPPRVGDKNRNTFENLPEDFCIMYASTIRDVSLAVWCPPKDITQSVCTIVSDPQSMAPAIESYNDEKEPQPCQAYAFDSDNSRPADYDWSLRKKKLLEWTFQYTNSEVSVEGKVDEIDIRHAIELIRSAGKRFSVPDKPTPEPQTGIVRSFPEMTYRSVADCSKMCSFDVDCRSYSYCSKTSECSITSLDLRKSEFLKQIMTTGSVITDKLNQDKYQINDRADCVIYERDYLDIFTLTKEEVQVSKSLTRSLLESKSAFECAKEAVDLESGLYDHHVASFAYCPTTNRCILDEYLVESPHQMNGTETVDDDDPRNEIRCIKYRKRYQNYFHVSPKVFVQNEEIHQLDIKSSVEECARACWHQFGQICASFDYCSPDRCLINEKSIREKGDKLMTEQRNDCLHYERDLRLDLLRKNHYIGRHEALAENKQQPAKQKRPITFGYIALEIFLVTLITGSFILGLLVGNRVNDRVMGRFGSPPGVARSNMNGFNNNRSNRATRQRMTRALLNWQSFARRFGGSHQWTQPFFEEDDALDGENAIAQDSINSHADPGCVSGNAIQMNVIKGAENKAYQQKDG